MTDSAAESGAPELRSDAKLADLAVLDPDRYIVEWYEPCSGVSASGMPKVIAEVTLRTSVRGAIEMVKERYKERGHEGIYTDAEYLTDFLVVHWATIIPPTNEDNCKDSDRREGDGDHQRA